MGVGGPQGKHFGLSKRMVQLYLLCLVQTGKLRISLSGKNMPVEMIDYTNITSIDFRTAILDAFDQVWRLKPPEGWDTLRPFAAVLLKDENIKKAQDDAVIQGAIQRLLSEWPQMQIQAKTLRQDVKDLMAELEIENPFDGILAKWEAFTNVDLNATDAITQIRHALEIEFGYDILESDQIKPKDVDDFASIS